MNNESLKKIRKAESLRTDSKFPFSLFTKPDYLESGELFAEVAAECVNLEDKIKYYKEAAITFSKSKSEYNQYRASECYKRVFELLQNEDISKAVNFYILHSECLERINKNMLAGQAYVKIGDIFKMEDPRKSIEMYFKAQDNYKRDVNCPYHYKEAVLKCLEIQLEIRDIEGAIDSLSKLEIKYSQLSKQMLKYVIGKTDFEDDLEKEESELMMILLNKEKSVGIKALEDFKEAKSIPEIIIKIFDIVIEEMRPENDIC